MKQETLAGEGVVTWLNAVIHSWQKKVLRKLKANNSNTKPVKSKAGKPGAPLHVLAGIQVD